MLRGVYLDNFVRFYTRQTIHFEGKENPYIFVGENGSGKSSVLEGIRRCLQKKNSTLWSSVFSVTGYSIFVCKYDTSNCSESKLKYTKMLFSGVITEAQDVNNSTNFKFVSTEKELLIDMYLNTTLSRSFREVDTSCVNDIFQQLQENKIKAEDIIDFSLSEKSEYLEDRLKLLEKYVIMTFPSRSIGPLQWSKSEKIDENKREKNYAEAGERAEIIRYFLDHQDEFDTTSEQEIFADLTDHDGIIFRYDEDNHVNVETERSENRLAGGKFALLKLPEGILEAKYLSILLSNKNCQTLALEEPDKGMHPQMVEKMLAVIQKYSLNKTVVLCTHNPKYVNLFTITRLLIFRKTTTTENDKRINHAVIISGSIIGQIKLPKEIGQIKLPKETNKDLPFKPRMKTLRVLIKDHVADVIFAKRILFCEGDSELLFLTALKGLAIKQSKTLLNAMKFVHNSDTNTLQRMLVSLHIFKLNGWYPQAEQMHKLCQELKLEEFYFVCDKDVIVHDNNMHFNQQNKWLGDAFKEIMPLGYNKETRERIKKECRVFFWQDGTIEDMVISLLRSDPCDKDVSEMHGMKTGNGEPSTKRSYDKVVFWEEKRGKIEQLKEINVHLPFDRWKKTQKAKRR